MTASLDEMVEAFRNRPLDTGPYRWVWVDALVQRVRGGVPMFLSSRFGHLF